MVSEHLAGSRNGEDEIEYCRDLMAGSARRNPERSIGAAG